jgi:hypothetical protein
VLCLEGINHLSYCSDVTSLVVEFLTTDPDVPGSIPGSAMRFFSLEGEGPHGDHGLGSSVEFRFKAPPGTSYSYITIHLIGTT